ncbi:MAG: glycosyltransferase, partial [Chitinophagaceae bacterium]
MWIVLYTILVGYLLLLVLYAKWWHTASKSVKTIPATTQHRFSILIPARNEAENIKQCLASIAALDYPASDYEVIVIDDFSTDDTVNIVNQMPGVRLIQLSDIIHSPINSYKKKAIEAGMAAAQFPWIVTTDADCCVPQKWLRYFNAILQNNQVQFVAAPVTMKNGNSFLEVFQSLDFMSLQGITAAAASAGFHHMCNGANLCYSKHAFEKVEGFKHIDHIASGDDMLLMQKIADVFPGGIAYCKEKEATVLTQPVRTIKDFLMQRIRWASKATSFRDVRIKAVLVGVYLFNLFLLLLMPAA